MAASLSSQSSLRQLPSPSASPSPLAAAPATPKQSLGSPQQLHSRSTPSFSVELLASEHASPAVGQSGMGTNRNSVASVAVVVVTRALAAVVLVVAYTGPPSSSRRRVKVSSPVQSRYQRWAVRFWDHHSRISPLSVARSRQSLRSFSSQKVRPLMLGME